MQETKQHQASDATVQSENFTTDVVSVTRKIKSPTEQYSDPAALDFFLDLARAVAERRTSLK